MYLGLSRRRSSTSESFALPSLTIPNKGGCRSLSMSVGVFWLLQLVSVLALDMKREAFRCCLIIQFVVVVFSSSSVSVEDEVQTLKAQMNALLQNRQQDYNQLEESLKKTFDKNVEVINLKNEIRDLR